MNEKSIEAAIKNMELLCEKLQADLKTHQQLQSDLVLLKELQKFWLDRKDVS